MNVRMLTLGQLLTGYMKRSKDGWLCVDSRNVLNAYDHRSQYRNRKPLV